MLYSWLYVLINSLSALLRQISGYQISPAFILCLGCIVVICYFHLINFGTLRTIYQQCWQHKLRWISLSFSITLIWLCAIYSPSFIGASLHTYLYFSVLGIMGIVALHGHDSYKQPSQLFSLIGLLSLLSFVVYTHIIHAIDYIKILGVLFACAGGVVGFIYAKQSDEFMSIAQLSASQILAIRFYLAIPISFLLIPQDFTDTITSSNFTLAIFTGIFCLILPIYFSQKGIEKAGAEISTIIVSITPLAVAVLEQAYFNNIAWSQFVIYSVYAALILLPLYTKRYAQRTENIQIMAK